jgi:hypothetical protein
VEPEELRLARDYVDTLREVMLELAPQVPAAGRLVQIMDDTGSLRANGMEMLREVMVTLSPKSPAAAKMLKVMDRAKMLQVEFRGTAGDRAAHLLWKIASLARDYVDTLREVMTRLAPEIPAAARLVRIIDEIEELHAEQVKQANNADYR